MNEKRIMALILMLMTATVFGKGERLVFNAFVPRQGALEDDADHFPVEYLDELAGQGVTGVCVPIKFRQIASTKLTPRTREGDLRLARLRCAAKKCARHGVRLWIYGNEPARFREGDAMLKNHPELGGAYFPTHGSTMWCPCEPAVKEYIKEAVQDLFTEVPELGGFLNIAYGEGLTTCLDAYECCPTVKYWAQRCERCARRPLWQGYREMSEAVVAGIRAAGSDAPYFSWFYQPMATTERSAFVAECAAHAPGGTTFVFNFETGAVLEQQGRVRCCGDYSLAIPGPGRPFAEIAGAARTAGVRLGAKIQTANSHELATIPDVPVPGLLYRKYEAMSACGVTDVVLGWTMGGEPGLMLRAANRLSDWDFTRGEDAFLRDLAVAEWGEETAETVVGVWKSFSDAFARYPVGHIVQYLGPFHAGIVWNLFAYPEAKNVLAAWKGFAEDNGDRVGECLGEFTLAEVERISGEMAELAAGKPASGEDPLTVLERMTAGNAERRRQVAMMRAFRLQLQAAHAVFGFYRRRAEALAASRTRDDRETALRLLAEMKEIVSGQRGRVLELLPLARTYSRLGYHADARVHVYSPESLDRQKDRLDQTRLDLETIEREIAAGGLWPLSEREKGSAKLNLGEEMRSGGVVWRVCRDGDDLMVSGACPAACEGLALVLSDLAGAGSPVVCHIPNPDRGEKVFEPASTTGACLAVAESVAKAGWRFTMRYPKAKWMMTGGWRPEWLALVEDTYPGKRGEVRPLWPRNERPLCRRGDLLWVDGAAFGKIVWPAPKTMVTGRVP